MSTQPHTRATNRLTMAFFNTSKPWQHNCLAPTAYLGKARGCNSIAHLGTYSTVIHDVTPSQAGLTLITDSCG